ncbi:enterochelin esterase [uncultured Streptomyces sp.]|uniref:enterochelin esterase n=1 Tax=uncultured Streptomyces sp. TaxID=174707 RepID=UPI00260298F1|nr:enterochelin esterase [uncultured Streptomyces sp.]
MPVSPPPTGAPRRPPRVPRPDAVPRIATPAAALPGPEGVEAYWREVSRRGTPLVTPDPEGSGDHVAVTFLRRGTPATRAVQVLPNKIGDPRAPEGNLMERLAGTDVWHWTLRLRHDWRGTYDFYVDEGEGPAPEDPGYWPALRTRRHGDPLNPAWLPRRWSADPVPYAELPAAPRAVDWTPRDDVPHGVLTEHELDSEHLGARCRVWRYEPAAGYRPAGDLPVLVLLDGEHWGPLLGLPHLLDNLIADGSIPPLVALLSDSVDPDTRWDRLTCRPEHTAFLTDELLPWAAASLPLTDDPARTAIAGQSLGGLTAAYAGLTASDRFGHVLAQSGSFWWPDGPDAEWLTSYVASTPRVPVRLRLSFGDQEWVALPAAARLRDALTAAGYDDAVYVPFNGGHDYLCWRTELADGLVEAFGGH